jgi:hypothetical protein
VTEEQLSSNSYSAHQLVFVALVWFAVSVAIVVNIVGAMRPEPRGLVFGALLFLIWVGITIPVLLIVREPHRVTLRNDVLRIYRWFGFTDIPLSRVRYVEHDLPGRGARRVILSIEPASPSERVLETIEFVPRGGELGLGGKEIADELRRKANDARGIRAAT